MYLSDLTYVPVRWNVDHRLPACELRGLTMLKSKPRIPFLSVRSKAGAQCSWDSLEPTYNPAMFGYPKTV